MIHKLDKETIKRIVDLHQEQGLSFPILGERFGVSTARIIQIIKYHRKKKNKNKKKKYEKFPKHLDKQRKTVSEQTQDELKPINSPMSDE